MLVLLNEREGLGRLLTYCMVRCELGGNYLKGWLQESVLFKNPVDPVL